MKKVGFLGLVVMAAMLLALAFPAAASGPSPAALPERHPHIEEALEAMRGAKRQLETADHDFGGHRVKAIQHLNAAIREAEVCMSMK